MAKKTVVKKNKKSSGKTLGVLNGDFPSEFYKTAPCRIGYYYSRLMVDGSVLPCCVSNLSLGTLSSTTSFNEVWFSDAYSAFREKTGRIHEEHFHMTDPEWAFCQQCSHVGINAMAFKESKKR